MSENRWGSMGGDEDRDYYKTRAELLSGRLEKAEAERDRLKETLAKVENPELGPSTAPLGDSWEERLSDTERESEGWKARWRASFIAAEQLRIELAELKSKTYCAYCGEEFLCDGAAEDISDHIKACPDHPMREAEGQLKTALAIKAKYFQMSQDSKGALAEAVKDKVKAESEVRRLRERIRKLWGERDRLREAGESLRAAMWDAYYGKGITIKYAQAVDKEWQRCPGREGGE